MTTSSIISTVHHLDPLRANSSYREVADYCARILAPYFESEVNPGAAERDAACEVIPRAAFEKAAEIGLLNYLIPAQVGGKNGSRRVFGMLLEEIGYYSDDPSYGTMLAMFADVPNVIHRAGRPSLVERYVKPMARGELLGTFAYTDYGDAFDFKTQCIREGSRYVINGVKCLQTGGALADVFVAYVQDAEDGGLKIFLIERDQPGVSLSQVKTMGLRSAGLTQLRLENVIVDEERLLNESDGLTDAQVFLNSRRIFVACPLVGVMKRTVELCTNHLDTVIREGRPLTHAQTVQARLGSMYSKWMTSQAILHTALDRIGSGDINEIFDPFISSAKLTITERAVEVGERAIRLTGWRGYSDHLPFERMFRGAMAAITGQTAQDVLEIQLGILAIAKIQVNKHMRE